MEGVVDSNMLLDIISSMEYLEVLHLFGMDGLTNDDIKGFIHSAKKLNTLIVKRCRVDSEDIIAFVNNTRRQFNYLKIIDDVDDYDYNYHDYDEDIFSFDFDTYL
ncbi:hypothetical protein BDC45DRAFT_512746 [Circinella umbellata]|nr:hypothetical protein BDC45DRAFT_512746 [Circinella umbellata]